MSQLRVILSTGGRDEFLSLLTESRIAFTERLPPLGVIVAAGGVIEVLDVVWSSLADVVVKWLHGKSMRSVTIQTENNFVELKGYSSEEVREILKNAVSMNVIQTTKDDC